MMATMIGHTAINVLDPLALSLQIDQNLGHSAEILGSQRHGWKTIGNQLRPNWICRRRWRRGWRTFRRQVRTCGIHGGASR